MSLIYLDHNATSPPSTEHLGQVFQKLQQQCGNPSSPHAFGRNASVALTEARRAVARSMGVDVSDVIFVSGGTEADNLGTAGVLYGNNIPIDQQHAVISNIEHPAISEPLEQLQLKQGLQLTKLPVDKNGYVSFEDAILSLTAKTTLLSIMAANNEIGTLQPVKKIADFLHYKRWSSLADPTLKDEFDAFSLRLDPSLTTDVFRNLHFHVDAVQTYGKLPHSLWFSEGMDSCALSAHKVAAMQGVGALILRRGRKFKPFIYGGAQEKNRRSGSENLPGIISFGLIAEEILQPYWFEQVQNMEHMRRDFFSKLSLLPNLEMNSSLENSVTNTINFSITGKKMSGEDLLVHLDLSGICASSGSACSSAANLPSKVILALGKSPQMAKNAVRFSLSLKTTQADILKTLQVIKTYLQS